MKIKKSPIDIFNFIRGGIRSFKGKEDFKNLKLLIIGMDQTGKDLLNIFCTSDIELFFLDNNLNNYNQAQMCCPPATFYEGQDMDIIVDFKEESICMAGKKLSLTFLNEDPYTQGIHSFYF